jgi:hypothetical protein
MRKFVFLTLLLALSAAPAAAQTIGFKIGPTFSKIDFEDDDTAETLTNFGGGGFIRFGAGGFTLQAELLALTKGAEQHDPASNITGKLKFTYVEIPVTAMFAVGNGPYLFAGPSVGFEVDCQAEIEGTGGSLSGDCGDDVQTKDLDVSLHGGAGIQFAAGPGSILVEGRYIYGLTDINDDPTEPGSAKNRTWAVMAGYAIRIGR